MASLVVVVLVMSMFSGGALAQSGCMSALMGLAPCLNYISGSSTTPAPSCCSQLASVVQSQPQCLCQVLNGGASNLGVTINQTQALTLPTACKVQTPPVSRCNSANQPSGSPAGAAASPISSPTASPADASTPPESSVTPDTPTSPTVSTPGGSSVTPTTPTSPKVSGIPSPTSSNPGTGSKSTTGSPSSGGNMTKFSTHFALFLIFITSSVSAIIAV